MRPTARLPLAALLLALVAALVTGCGSDDGDAPTSSKQAGADQAASTNAEDLPADGLVATLDARLDVRLENVGSKDFPGLPVPAAMKCTRSIPATCSATITCPAEADDAKGVELCGWLAGTGSSVLLSKDDPAQACTQQYGGPEVATVTGTIGDKQVDATFSRQDGCAIGRFDEASPLWTGEVPVETKPVDGSGGAAAGSCPALPPDAPVSNTPGDPAAGAADGVCATPATTAPTPAPGTPLIEPEIISDPPEAFELEK